MGLGSETKHEWGIKGLNQVAKEGASPHEIVFLTTLSWGLSGVFFYCLHGWADFKSSDSNALILFMNTSFPVNDDA